MFTQTSPRFPADKPKMDTPVDPRMDESSIGSEYESSSSSSSSHHSNKTDNAECDDEVDNAKAKSCVKQPNYNTCVSFISMPTKSDGNASSGHFPKRIDIV